MDAAGARPAGAGGIKGGAGGERFQLGTPGSAPRHLQVSVQGEGA